MNINIAVLTFPGNNCEKETLRALKDCGFSADIFLWNQNSSELLTYDGVVIPGGFSFEDRGRSGIVSVQEEVFHVLKKMGEMGKPILGICNGAQMLVESGLILQDTEKKVPSLALLRNERKDKSGAILGTGFYHKMVHMKPVNNKTPFSNFSQTLYVPIAHGEGRFTAPKEIEQEIITKNLVVFQYTDQDGIIDPHYPTNPNGSLQNAAALCNPKGNIVAMMPHPERLEEGYAVFKSFFEYFQNPWKLNNKEESDFVFPKRVLQKKQKPHVSLIIKLKITDKTEKTFEQVVRTQQQNHEITLLRREQWDIDFSHKLSTKEILKKCEAIITSNELINTNKQWCVAQIGEEYYDWNDGKFDLSSPRFSTENMFLAQEKQDFRGAAKLQHIQHELPELNLEKISFFVSWEGINIEREGLCTKSLFASYTGENIFEA